MSLLPAAVCADAWLLWACAAAAEAGLLPRQGRCPHPRLHKSQGQIHRTRRQEHRHRRRSGKPCERADQGRHRGLARRRVGRAGCAGGWGAGRGVPDPAGHATGVEQRWEWGREGESAGGQGGRGSRIGAGVVGRRSVASRIYGQQESFVTSLLSFARNSATAQGSAFVRLRRRADAGRDGVRLFRRRVLRRHLQRDRRGLALLQIDRRRGRAGCKIRALAGHLRVRLL